MPTSSPPLSQISGGPCEFAAPDNLECAALQPLCVDLPKTSRSPDTDRNAYGAFTGQAQRQVERDKALAAASDADSPGPSSELARFQSIGRLGRSVGFVKVRPLTAESVAALSRPLRMSLAPAKLTSST